MLVKRSCQDFPASDFIRTPPSPSPLFFPHHPSIDKSGYYRLYCVLYFTAVWCMPSLPSTKEEARANLASQGMCTPQKFLCYPVRHIPSPNHVVPQLLWKLLYTGVTPYLRSTSCRNSRENYLLLQPFAVFESHHAATRVTTVPSWGHFLLAN
jgi:hypothetical protein